MTLVIRGGQLLNQEVVWRTKQGNLVHVLLSYVQSAYRGGHISFTGGSRLLWVYDVTAQTRHESQVFEQERQLREMLVRAGGHPLIHLARWAAMTPVCVPAPRHQRLCRVPRIALGVG